MKIRCDGDCTRVIVMNKNEYGRLSEEFRKMIKSLVLFDYDELKMFVSGLNDVNEYDKEFIDVVERVNGLCYVIIE